MNRLLMFIAGVSALGVYFVITPMVVSGYRRYRGHRTIICPETGRIAEVDLKAGRAGLLSIFGESRARVKRCSQWPRNRGCAEECVTANWEAAPDAENYRIKAN